MSSNVFKVSLESNFKLDIDRILSSDSSSVKVRSRTENEQTQKNESNKRSRTENDFRNRMSYKPQNFNRKDNLFDVAQFEMSEDFIRRMEVQKSMLIEFTERSTHIYSTKFGELLRRQEAELNQFKKDFLRIVKSELEKWKKCLNCIRHEEAKLMKLLEYLKQVYNSPEIQSRRLRKITDMHKDFLEKYEELIARHRSEVNALREDLDEEITRLKQNFIQVLKK